MEKKPHHADERAKPHTREMKSLSRLVVTGVPTKEGEAERSICTAGRAAGGCRAEGVPSVPKAHRPQGCLFPREVIVDKLPPRSPPPQDTAK